MFLAVHAVRRARLAGGEEHAAMPASGTGTRGQELARHVFDLITQFCLAMPRNRRRAGDLKEIEFLTLSLLHQHGTLIVGDIQRHLGVLPAQMSRIIRSLETRDRPLIVCRINPQDKRKIDVELTPAGHTAFAEYLSARIAGIARLIGQLPEEDLDDLHRLVGRLLDLQEMSNGEN
jgi:DNA-binding MarR family transcriptional regulator